MNARKAPARSQIDYEIHGLPPGNGIRVVTIYDFCDTKAAARKAVAKLREQQPGTIFRVLQVETIVTELAL